MAEDAFYAKSIPEEDAILQTITRNVTPVSDPKSGDDKPKPLRRRARRACLSCRSRKVRCDVTHRVPCGNCSWDHIECVVVSRRGKRCVTSLHSHYNISCWGAFPVSLTFQIISPKITSSSYYLKTPSSAVEYPWEENTAHITYFLYIETIKCTQHRNFLPKNMGWSMQNGQSNALSQRLRHSCIVLSFRNPSKPKSQWAHLRERTYQSQNKDVSLTRIQL